LKDVIVSSLFENNEQGRKLEARLNIFAYWEVLVCTPDVTSVAAWRLLKDHKVATSDSDPNRIYQTAY
jgi:hypothetical protein